MNPNELREHLRTTLDPVGTPAPSVRSLRAVAHRRTRQNRGAAGVLAVMVLAAGVVGIGLATRGGGGVDRVAPAFSSPSSPSVVAPTTSADETTACSTGAVTLTVGQQLSISDCQPQAEFADSDESVLAPGAVPQTYPTPLPVFTAKKPGTVTIGLSRRPVCVPGGACSQLIVVVGTITVTVVAGPTSPTTSASASASASASPAYDVDEPSTWRVSVTGYGPLRIGMTPAQIEALVPTAKEESGGADPASCEYVGASALPGVQLLILDGTFALTEADGAGVESVSGIHVGMSEAALRGALGPSATVGPTLGAGEVGYDLKTSEGEASADVRGGVVTSYQEGRVANFQDGCV